VRRSVSTLLALAVATAVAACGGSATDGAAGTTGGQARVSSHERRAKRKHTATARAAVLSYRRLYSLPAPLRDPAYASLGGGRFVLIGGLSASDTSTTEVDTGDQSHVTQATTLGVAQHDAQAALLEGRVYVFGGGSFSELDHIFSFSPATGALATVGSLPAAQSDVGVTAIGNTAYVVGGYDGVNWKNTILAYSPGASTTRTAGTIPVGLRYAAVAAIDGRVLIAGGSTPTAASRAIFSFDPRTGRVVRIGTLPQPVTHGELAPLGQFAYLVGGRGNGTSSQTARIFAIDPATGKVTPAGRLPTGLSDAALLPAGHSLLLIGGLESSGAVSDQVAELVPVR
jgi:N-acetylneuraminic acid mutarotase